MYYTRSREKVVGKLITNDDLSYSLSFLILLKIMKLRKMVRKIPAVYLKGNARKEVDANIVGVPSPKLRVVDSL